MMKSFLCILYIGIMSGCVSHYKGVELSVLTINSKKANSKIVDRHPDYVDGHKDGCLIMSEMRLDLKTEKTGLVNGIITDVSTGEPLHNALVSLKNDQNLSFQTKTDSLGLFQTNIAGKMIEIQAEYIGYRSMLVRF